MWDLYERVCMAAFDLGRFVEAKECLKALKEQFGGQKSKRYVKLVAMVLGI